MAKATAIFDADDSRLQQAVKRIDKGLLAVQARFASLAVGGAKIAAPIVAAVAILAAGIAPVLNVAGGLADLSKNSGQVVKDLMIMGQEFKNAGKEGGDAGAALNKMTKSLASEEGQKAVKALGINLEELKKKTPTEQFQEIGKAIDELPNHSARLAAATAIFGKSGSSLLAVFSARGFGDAAAQVGAQADILNRNAALFDDVGDKLGLGALKIQGFFVGVAEKIIPLLKPLVDRFATLDLSGFGQQLGDVVAFLFQTIADGSIGDLLLTSIQIGLSNVGNFLAGILFAAGSAFGSYLVESGRTALELFSILTTGEFWAGMGNTLVATAKSFVAVLLDGVAMMLDKLASVPWIGDKATAAADSARQAAGELRGQAGESANTAVSQLAPQVERIQKRLSEAAGNFMANVQAGWEQGTNVFDTSEFEKHLGEVVQDVMDGVAAQQEAALKEVPTVAPTNDPSAPAKPTSEPQLPVSALTRIGGNFGTGAADPIAESNRLLREGNDISRNILSAISSGGLQTGTLVTTPIYGG